MAKTRSSSNRSGARAPRRAAASAGAPNVWKFGGASLADATAVSAAAERIAAHDGPLVVVASALAGVTDLLLLGADHAVHGRPRESAATAVTLWQKHQRAAEALLPRGTARRAALAEIEASIGEYADICTAVGILGHLSPRTRDLLVARGERLSAMLLAAAIARAGRRAQYVDAVDIVMTDGHFGGASPLIPESATRARKMLQPLLKARTVPVVPGFIGRAPEGGVATLGRGGSDLTATLLGRAFNAPMVTLWKDVPGILTSDPKLVPDTRLIPQLHHQEAAEVAHYGAKVLHPRALIPISGTKVVLEVRSFLEPTRPGTIVAGRHVSTSYPVKAVAVLPKQAVVTVAGKGMVGVHGIAARTFAAVDAERLSVSTIFQGSSESSIGFTLPEAEAERAVASLRRAFREEIAGGLIDGVTARPDMSVIAVVGDGMAGTPGIAARVFTALETSAINIVAIAQGSSERNISFVVSGADAATAARKVHSAFQLSKIGGGRPPVRPSTDVVLLGFGRVGRALATLIATSPAKHRVRIVGLLDRSGYVFDARGLPEKRLRSLAEQKDGGALLTSIGGKPAGALEALGFMSSHAVSRPVLVDVTSDETSPILHAAIERGFDIVLANKRPLAGSWESYTRLLGAAADAGRTIRFEATVGAGLPVIDTHKKLAETGDQVLRVDGCVSGTLMFVLSEVCGGRPFSEAVKDAVERGYAEPDPRDDLSGQDAARKGLILARLLGYRGASPVPENLVPPAYQKLPLATFMTRLPELDADWTRRVARAAARGHVLRYVVSATRTRAFARLVSVEATSPLGSAGGARNLITFTSARYHDEPLVVSGPGAGPAVTAAGILNDIIALGAPSAAGAWDA
jgi:bifunctional aspartokinase / homoserine dehydrogenase 1